MSTTVERVPSFRSACRAIRPQIFPIALAMVPLVHPIAKSLARLDWRADLVSHFQGPAFVLTIACATLLTWKRRRILAGALVVLALAQIPPLWQFQRGNPVPFDPNSSERLRVLCCNVLSANSRFEVLADLIRAEQPDVVGLVEYSSRWQDGMAEIAQEFPYRVEYPCGTRGVALWLKQPPPLGSEPPQLVFAGTSGNPALRVSTEFAGQPIDIWLVHPPNPLDPRGRSQGRPELMRLAKVIGQEDRPRLIIGDLNRTEGSPIFQDFLKATGTRDSRFGFGRQPSWPTWKTPYRLPIDHAFPGPELAVIDRRLGPNVHSDHFPLIVEFAPALVADRSRSPGSARNETTQSAQTSGW